MQSSLFNIFQHSFALKNLHINCLCNESKKMLLIATSYKCVLSDVAVSTSYFCPVRNLQNVYELLVGHVPPFWGSVSITDLWMSHRNYWCSGWWAGYFSPRFILFLSDWLALAVFGIVTGCCPGLSTLSSLCWRAVSLGISLLFSSRDLPAAPNSLPAPPFPYLSK